MKNIVIAQPLGISSDSLHSLTADLEKEGYKVPLEMIWDYFCSFNEYLNLDYTTTSFKLMNILSQLGNRLIEKLYFIPKVYENGNFFYIRYEILK